MSPPRWAATSLAGLITVLTLAGAFGVGQGAATVQVSDRATLAALLDPHARQPDVTSEPDGASEREGASEPEEAGRARRGQRARGYDGS